MKIRIIPLSLLMCLTMACNRMETSDVSANYHLEINLEQDETWWVGVISQAHLFPLTAASEYQFDFFGNTAGNQGQPLLLSNKGRYIWNEEPFSFSFENGKITCECGLAGFQKGQAGTSLKEAYLFCSKTFFPPSGKIPAEELFTLPQFNTWIEFAYDQNQEGILEYARNIVKQGFEPGVLMIDEGWFKNYGEWEFHEGRFPDPDAMMKELKALGFSVILWICPYYSPDGAYWKDQWLRYTNEGDTIWIVNAENPYYPAVMQWWDGFSNVIDLSNPKGISWFKEQMENLVQEYGIVGFKLDGGDAVHYSRSRFLSDIRSYQQDITPNGHSELFVRVGLEYPFNEYRAAWKMGGQPIAMRLRDKNHNWEDLQKLVPGSINQGLMGYPFTCPDLIGGGEYLSFIDLEKIDQELVVRAAQCHALMPMMQFSVAPWRILSPENLGICLDMANLHVEMGETILNLAKEAGISGEPIVRSLEYEYPGKGYETITDQFLLGKSILVAPVVESGARTRTIVFPEGTWKGDDGSLVTGPMTLEVNAPLTRLPWYKIQSFARVD
jgi:alpha-glucosidase (family GH31 glycosyl hydrolase)